MNETEEFAKVLKYGKCNSSTHGRCKGVGSKHKRSCPMPRLEAVSRHFCHCCDMCYGHCIKEAEQNNDDYMEAFREWSSWKSRTKRNIEDKITRWCGST